MTTAPATTSHPIKPTAWRKTPGQANLPPVQDRPVLRVLSLGAGVQSTTLALLAVEGQLPKPDAAIFADTGWEPRAVYDHLTRLRPVVEQAGIEVRIVSTGNLRDDALNPDFPGNPVPAYVRNPDGSNGVLIRSCTGRYKIEPIAREIRQMLGAATRTVPCRYCDTTGQRVIPWDTTRRGQCVVCRGTGQRTLIGPAPKGKIAEQWIGFSTDEIGRVSGKGVPAWSRPRYPLLELGMSRKDCERWLAGRGWQPTKSACIGCPFHGNARWRDMRDHHPAEFADAVDFDQRIRTSPMLRGQMYLHRSRLPLADAPVSRITPAEWKDMQLDLFDLLTEDEHGDPDGCSPYGCRSGARAEGAAA